MEPSCTLGVSPLSATQGVAVVLEKVASFPVLPRAIAVRVAAWAAPEPAIADESTAVQVGAGVLVA